MGRSSDVPLSSINKDWAKGVFKKAYLLGGPDLLTKEEAVAQLTKRFLGPDPSGMGMDSFDGNEASAGAILSAASTLPFFSGRRLVVVRRAERLTAGESALLADGLSSIPETNCLVLLSETKPDSRAVLVQSVLSVGAVTTVWPPFENQMPAWVMERVESLGKKMDRETAQTLLDTVGPSLSDLVQEIRKLELFTKDRPLITSEDVTRVCGERISLRFMEWERALWLRQRGKALALLETLRQQGEPVMALLSQVTRAVQKLVLGKTLFHEKKITRMDVFKQLKIGLLDAQNDFFKGLDGWTYDDLLKALDELVTADVNLKSGRTSPDADLTRLVCSLTAD